MHIQEHATTLRPLTVHDAAPGRNVLVVNAHGILRVLRVRTLNGHRLTLEDGSAYHWHHAGLEFRPHGSGPHAGAVYRWSAAVDVVEVNREYDTWHARFHQDAAERATRVQLATAAREVARRVATAPDLHTLSIPELEGILASLRATAAQVAA